MFVGVGCQISTQNQTSANTLHGLLNLEQGVGAKQEPIKPDDTPDEHAKSRIWLLKQELEKRKLQLEEPLGILIAQLFCFLDQI